MARPTKLDGLFSFALFSGLTLAIQLHYGMDISETGIGLTIIENVSKIFGNSIQNFLPIVSIIFALGNGGVTTHHVITAIEHKVKGVVVSGGGFFGMLSLILGSLAGFEWISYFGMFLCIMGGVISGVSRKL